MDYSFDTSHREHELSANTGYGDTSTLTDDDAVSCELGVCALTLRVAFLNEHGTSGSDPDADRLLATRDALADALADALEVRDRIVASTGTDVTDVMGQVLEVNRRKAEQDHFDAMWGLANVPNLAADQRAELELIRDRAEREVAVIDGWVPTP